MSYILEIEQVTSMHLRMPGSRESPRCGLGDFRSNSALWTVWVVVCTQSLKGICSVAIGTVCFLMSGGHSYSESIFWEALTCIVHAIIKRPFDSQHIPDMTDINDGS